VVEPHTDDRALADLIAELRAAAKPGYGAALDWSHEECATYWARVAEKCRKALRDAADRLEAFHAKPVVGERAPAQFFFEVGFGAAYAQALIANDMKPPFALTDAVVEHAWDIAGEAHDDPEEFDRYLALANRAALQSPPPVVSGEDKLTMTIRLTDDEQAAIERLMTEQELSRPQIFRCALRSYQADHERRKAGETVTWSGDAQRARDFAGPLATPPVVEEGRREAAIDVVDRARQIAQESYASIRPTGGKFWGELDDMTQTLAIVAARDAILALTPVEGVGEERLEVAARVIDPAAFDDDVVSYRNDEHREQCQWDAIEKARTILSTPVAAQGDVRDDLWSLEQRLTDGEFFSDYDEDLRLLGVFRRFLATLGAPHEG